jgi:hypothetical protein
MAGEWVGCERGAARQPKTIWIIYKTRLRAMTHWGRVEHLRKLSDKHSDAAFTHIGGGPSRYSALSHAIKNQAYIEPDDVLSNVIATRDLQKLSISCSDV